MKMKRSEFLYGAAVGIVVLIAATADSPAFGLWTVIAVVGLIGATLLVRAAKKAERMGT
jgi:hypothetical protein